MVSAESQTMASSSNMNMETEIVLQQPVQAMDFAKAPPPADASPAGVMDVPEQIVVDKKDRKKDRSKSHRSSRKEKVAKKHSSSSGKHERHRSQKHSDRKRRRKHRKDKHKLDPNDPEVIAKSRELSLAAMGVKKQPDVAPCFVSANSSLDNNPVYQRNKDRISKLAHSQSESALSISASRSSFTMDGTARSIDDSNMMVGFHNNHNNSVSGGGTASSSSAQDDSEYDQYVEF